MSSYGTIITNYNNKVVIDSQFPNYALKNTGSKNLTSGINYLTGTWDTPSMIFFRPSTVGYCAWAHINRYGDNITAFGMLSNTTQTIQYVILKSGQVNTIPVNTKGIAFYDSNGNVTFSSEDTYSKVLDVQKISSISSYTSPGVNYTVINADTNYFLFNNNYVFFYYSNNVSYVYTLGMKKINTTTIQLKPIFWYSHSMLVGINYTVSGSGMIDSLGVKLLEIGVS